MRYTEEQLKKWTAPLSETENTSSKNTIAMIKSAIDAAPDLNDIDIEIFYKDHMRTILTFVGIVM